MINMIGTWKFGILDKETLQRVYIMSCRRCDNPIPEGDGYGLKIIEHVPRWKFWVRSTRVDSYCFPCAFTEIQSSLGKGEDMNLNDRDLRLIETALRTYEDEWSWNWSYGKRALFDEVSKKIKNLKAQSSMSSDKVKK